MKKSEAGYHMLRILAGVDHDTSSAEETIIANYIQSALGGSKGCETCKESFEKISKEQWESHFSFCRDEFYKDSNEKERNQFLQVAMDIVKTDNMITLAEDHFLVSKLFKIWDPETE